MILPFLAAAWLFAIASVALWGAPGWMAGATIAGLVPVALLLRGRRAATYTTLAAVVALTGGMRFASWYDRPLPDLARYVGRTLSIEGHIDAEANPGTTTASYRFAADHIRVGDDWVATNGKLMATFDQYAGYLPGDHLTLTGKLEDPPIFPDFDYRSYLARGNTVATVLFPRVEVLEGAPRWQLARLVAEIRNTLEHSLDRSLPEPEASLGAGIAFGRDGNVPDALYTDFRDTGIAHIVAVSGSNVSIVAALVFVLFVPLVGRRIATGPAAATVAAYLIVAGLSASVVRAGIMAGVFLLGEYLGRQQTALTALGVAAIGMTTFQPAAALDLGFQLSLAATAGLIVFGPWIRFGIEQTLRRLRLAGVVPRFAVQVTALSLSATLATLPIVWTNLGQVSIVGPLANVVVEPIFAVAFWLSAVTAVAGTVSTTAGRILGFGAYLPLSFMTWFAREAAHLPAATVNVPGANGQLALLIYLALGTSGIPAYLRLAPSFETPAPWHPAAARTAAVSFGLAAVAVFGARIGLLASGPSGKLEVTALDVGQGDAILVTTPRGHHWLIDGGPSGIELARELGAVLSPRDRTIERIYLTHPQQDHLAGFADLLARYDVKSEFDTGRSSTIPAYSLYTARARNRSEVHAGDSVSEDGVLLEVLWPPPGYDDPQENNSTLVLRITYGATRVLLASDAEARAQLALMEEGDVTADVLKVPHHGSKTTSPDFLAAVAPSVALISVGADNSYGHPNQETLDALTGATILRTDLQGRVTVRSDGTHITASTER